MEATNRNDETATLIAAADSSRIAVLIMQMGGARTLDEVPEYIRLLFSDADLVRLPPPISWFRAPLARWVSRKRAPRVREQYKIIGGGSPNNRITCLQAAALQNELNKDQDRFRCYAAMTYTPPSAADALRQALADGCGSFLAISAFPHFSTASTGASLSDLRRACLEVGLPLDEVQTLTEWGEDPSFLDALAARVHSAWQEAASFTSAGIPHLVISAHGVPESYVRRGDPYVDQIHASVRGLLKRLPENVAHTLCFQSRATPFKWVGPATDATLKKLAEEGNHNLVILPISFINDHVETLFEIDHELTNIAKAAGAQRVTRVPAFNDDADLVTVLAGLVQQKVVVATPTLP